MRAVYTEEQKKFFRDFVPGHKGIEITEEFNRRFNACITYKQVRSYMKNNKLNNGAPKGNEKGQSRVFPREVQKFITAQNPGRTAVELTALVNSHFQTNYTLAQLKAFRKNHRLVSGLTGRFEKGHPNLNKGRKGICFPGSEKGWFKKGQTPYNHLSVGTEIIDTQGYLKVKIAEPNVWKFRHIMEWEKAHGEVPAGCNIIFKDGNKLNCNPENLECVERAVHGIMNLHGLRFDSAILMDTGIAIARLKHKASELSKEGKGCRK